jgi:cytidylate kinase
MKVYDKMIPSIERRLNNWMALAKKWADGDERGPRPTITLSRRYGCEAYPLAETLVELLQKVTGEEWNIYDKALLEKVSADEQLSLPLLKNLEMHSKFNDYLASLSLAHKPYPALFQTVIKHMLQVAVMGNAIIVGRGGVIITQKLTNCYHFRLEADFAFRTASIARRMEISAEEAKKMIKDNQDLREHFIREYLGVADSHIWLYDAMYNNARHTQADMARSIIAYVASGWEDKNYFRLSVMGS